MDKIVINPIKLIEGEKKEYRVRPTEKQKKAFKSLVENGSTKKEAMRAAGYSKAIQVVPSKITESRGWQILLEENLPDDKLMRVLNEGLGAISEKGFEDYAVRHKYLDTGIKLKGYYAPEKHEVSLEDKMLEDIAARRRDRAKAIREFKDNSDES